MLGLRGRASVGGRCFRREGDDETGVDWYDVMVSSRQGRSGGRVKDRL